MPLISPSSYTPPPLFSNGHLQTIFPNLLRKVRGIRYQRERISTPDDDFLDLDWSPIGSTRVAILLHGLEGNSMRPYMLGMVKALNKHGWDAVALNFRSCSGEPNRQLRFYHSGATDDLQTVIAHVTEKKIYSEIAIIGFSLGGNITLKYLGEEGRNVSPLIKRAVTFSVPCDLESGAKQSAGRSNRIYMALFLRSLQQKIKAKMHMAPNTLSVVGFHEIKTFRGFDDRYTAPLHGFKDAEEYWRLCSSKQFLPRIAIPTLLVNARDDPFLGDSCYPIEEAEGNGHFFLEMPDSGGHVGFVTFNNQGEYWSETRALRFINEC